MTVATIITIIMMYKRIMVTGLVSLTVKNSIANSNKCTFKLLSGSGTMIDFGLITPFKGNDMFLTIGAASLLSQCKLNWALN